MSHDLAGIKTRRWGGGITAKAVCTCGWTSAGQRKHRTGDPRRDAGSAFADHKAKEEK